MRRCLSLLGPAGAIERPQTKAGGPPAGCHWPRSLIVTPDRTRLYAGLGSLSNMGDKDSAPGRARGDRGTRSCEWDSQHPGLCNIVDTAWEPPTNMLWVGVNECRGLGDLAAPDYLPLVREGSLYGWAYCNWGKTIDDRSEQRSDWRTDARLCPWRAHGLPESFLMPVRTQPGFEKSMMIA